jgi:hypothetical protein
VFYDIMLLFLIFVLKDDIAPKANHITKHGI